MSGLEPATTELPLHHQPELIPRHTTWFAHQKWEFRSNGLLTCLDRFDPGATLPQTKNTVLP